LVFSGAVWCCAYVALPVILIKVVDTDSWGSFIEVLLEYLNEGQVGGGRGKRHDVPECQVEDEEDMVSSTKNKTQEERNIDGGRWCLL